MGFAEEDARGRADRLKIAGICTLRRELWSADYLLAPSLFLRPSVPVREEVLLPVSGLPCSAPVISRTLRSERTSSSPAGHTATFLAFSWTIATRTARLHFILPSTVRGTTTTPRAARTLPSRLYLLILDVNAGNERTHGPRRCWRCTTPHVRRRY